MNTLFTLTILSLYFNTKKTLWGQATNEKNRVRNFKEKVVKYLLMTFASFLLFIH